MYNVPLSAAVSLGLGRFLGWAQCFLQVPCTVQDGTWPWNPLAWEPGKIGKF